MGDDSSITLQASCGELDSIPSIFISSVPRTIPGQNQAPPGFPLIKGHLDLVGSMAETSLRLTRC